MQTRDFKMAYALIVLLGTVLWGINWWANRPLFIDEANVARNLFDRSFAGLFAPLDHQQYAPPFYLVLVKCCGELFGYGERALRLPSLLGGLLAAAGLTWAGKELKLGGWTLLPVTLLFVNPMVLRFVGELKPYALDVGIASVILAFAVGDRRPSWRWAAGGMTAIWFSLPATFVLAATGLVALYESGRRDRWKWLGIAAGWMASLGLLYLLVLRPSIGSSYLNTFHRPYFFSLPFTADFDHHKSLSLLAAQPRLAFGFTILSIAWSSIILAFVSWKGANRTNLLLFLPVVIVFAASSLNYYSLISRLLLFTLPGWWLMAASASRDLTAWLRKRAPRYVWLPVVLWVFTATGTNVGRHYVSPLKFSDSRQLVTELDEGYTPIVDDISHPAFDYYHRIHPTYAGRWAGGQPLRERLSKQPLTGKYVMLYDVLTDEKYGNHVRPDSIWAVEHGATEVRLERYFRAARLYVALPEPGR